jgi:hypothetical protein
MSKIKKQTDPTEAALSAIEEALNQEMARAASDARQGAVAVDPPEPRLPSVGDRELGAFEP